MHYKTEGMVKLYQFDDISKQIILYQTIDLKKSNSPVTSHSFFSKSGDKLLM
jgi:hypothetical protein